jgi:hypothetical protein
VIEARSRQTRIVGAVTSAESAVLGLRLLGSGGLYGYLGWFRVGRGRARAFVTDRRRTVVVVVGETHVAISPVTPADLLEHGDA